ncbi:NACHT domain-containing protein [Serratia marcescens]|nr:NACHT domain-containing protein [Serratia marcescens]
MVAATGASLAFLGGQVTRIGNKLADDFIYPQIKSKILELKKTKPKYNARAGVRLLQNIMESDSYNSIVTEMFLKNLHIKTISPSKNRVYIDDVYVDLDVDDENGLIKIYNATPGKVYCIEGIAGQGKSTLMKKILLELIKKPGVFPIFIELKDLKERTIIKYISDILSRHNVEHNEADVVSLINTQKVTVLLDGFDELSYKEREIVYIEIEGMSSRSKAPIIISTRPDTEIANSYMVKDTSYKIQNLDKIKVLSIVEKNVDEDQRKSVLSILEANDDLMDSLKTPILVSLFCFCYPYSDIIPENAIEYYSRIFDIVYEGHDKRKEFFDREKKFKVRTSEAKKIFNAFSYLSLMKKKTSFDREFAVSAISTCLVSTGNKDRKGCEDDILDDLINVTSLIIDDGLYHYSYIHRTIQEYHAAVFVKDATQEAKNAYQKTITDKLVNGDHYIIGMTSFLDSLDQANTTKNILTPIFEKFGIDSKEKIEMNSKLIMDEVCNNAMMELILHKEEKHKKGNISTLTKTYMFGISSKDKLSISMMPFFGKDPKNIAWFNGLMEKHTRQEHINWFVNHSQIDEEGTVSKIEVDGKAFVQQSFKPILIKTFLTECNLYDSVMNDLKGSILNLFNLYKERKEKNDDEDVILI